MEKLTQDEMNLVIQRLTEYQGILQHDIKANLDNEITDYDEFENDKVELETVWNILKKLRGE